MKIAVQRHCLTNLEDLHKFCQEERGQITPDKSAKVVYTYLKRFIAVIAAKAHSVLTLEMYLKAKEFTLLKRRPNTLQATVCMFTYCLQYPTQSV